MVSGDPRVSRKSGRDSHGRLNRKLALRCQDKVWLKWIEGMKQNFWKAREFCVFALRCVQDESERLLCTSVRSDTEWRGFAKCLQLLAVSELVNGQGQDYVQENDWPWVSGKPKNLHCCNLKLLKWICSTLFSSNRWTGWWTTYLLCWS